MAHRTGRSVNWEPYEAEILSLYKGKNWKLRHVMAHMEKKGLRASVKQYKTRFPNLKNLKKEEWLFVVRRMKASRLRGEPDPQVLLNDEPVEKAKILRVFERYSATAEDGEDDMTTNVYGRITIKNPQPTAVLENDWAQSFGSPLLPGLEPLSSPLLAELGPLSSPRPLSPGPWASMWDFPSLNIEMESGSVLSNDPTPCTHTTLPSLVILPAQGQASVIPTNIMPRASPNRELSPRHSESQIYGYLNTPRMVHSATSTQTPVRRFPYTPVEISRLLHNIPSIQVFSLYDQFRPASVYPSVVDPPTWINLSHNTSYPDTSQGIPTPISRLQRQISAKSPFWPIGQPQPTSSNGPLVGAFPDVKLVQARDLNLTTYELSFQEFFFRVTNNLGEMTQMLDSIIDNRAVSDAVLHILRVRAPGSQAFLESAIRGAIRTKNKGFMRLLADASIRLMPFVGILADGLMHSTFDIETILVVDVGLGDLDCETAGPLLTAAAERRWVELAEVLLEAGVDANGPADMFGRHNVTPLIAASRCSMNFPVDRIRSLSIARLLLEHGADVHLRVRDDLRVGDKQDKSIPFWARASALGAALYDKRVDIEAILIEQDAFLNEEDFIDWSEWSRVESCYNMYRGDRQYVFFFEKMCQESPSPFDLDLGHTPFASILDLNLRRAIEYGDVNRVHDILIARGFSPTLPPDNKRKYCSGRQRIKCIVQSLLAAGISVNDKWFVQLAMQGGSDTVNMVIDAGLDLSLYGGHAIEAAAIFQHSINVVTLLERGVNPNGSGQYFTPLQAAAVSPYSFPFLRYENMFSEPILRHIKLSSNTALPHNSVDIMRYLLTRGANASALLIPRHLKYTALQVACASGNVDAVALLLEHGADPNEHGSLGHYWRPLEIASLGGSYTYGDYDDSKYPYIFDLLLDNGAQWERADKSSNPILANITGSYLRNRVKLDSFKQLFQTYNLNNETNLDGYKEMSYPWCPKLRHASPKCSHQSALQQTAAFGDIPMTKYLIEQGADINLPASEFYGRTALQAAVIWDEANVSTSSMRILSVCGQDQQLKVKHQLIKILLDSNAQVNAPPARVGGLTALQAAAIKGDLEIAVLLIENGADVNGLPSEEEGRYAIEGAAEHGRIDMVQFLLNAGSRGDIQTETGFNHAIEFAEREGHMAIAGLLKDAQRRQAEHMD